MPGDLLRFATAGSVDDGKSTLIGRLLFDSKALFSDQLAAVERVSRDRGHDYTDLALITDGLRAEREQGITIDVAYRYFATPRRKFIIADTPGHIQYTRNMVTGASTADVALVLLDARRGITEQSRRHAFIASLLGVPTSSCASTRWTSSTTSEAVFEGDPRRVRRVRHAAAGRRPDVHPDLRAARRQRRDPLGEHAVVRRARPCSATSSGSTWPATATSSTSASRSSTWSGRSRTRSATTAATPGPWHRACSARAIACWCCRAGSSRPSPRSRRPMARSTRRSRRWPWSSPWPTTSTSAAAT